MESSGLRPPVPTSLYAAIRARRDVRGQFTGGPIDAAALRRILEAAHAAPSVGMSQPWDFVLVESIVTRSTFAEHVNAKRRTFAATLNKERADTFAGLKIEGVLDASLGIVVTYDDSRGAPAVLGRHTIADAGLYSVCLAIENLWLAATCEAWGIGWVSFYDEAFLADLVGIPAGIRPVAWLCAGPVTHLEDVPDLERHGWQDRRAVDAVIHHERW